VVAGEDDVGVRQPTLGMEVGQHSGDGFVDVLVHHMGLGVDLTDLVVSARSWREASPPAFDIG